MRQIFIGCYDAPYEGHFGGIRTAAKVLQSDYFWPSLFKDVNELAKAYDRCQRVENISMRKEMSFTNILGIEFFDVRRIDFMGPNPYKMQIVKDF